MKVYCGIHVGREKLCGRELDLWWSDDGQPVALPWCPRHGYFKSLWRSELAGVAMFWSERDPRYGEVFREQKKEHREAVAALRAEVLAQRSPRQVASR